MSFGRDFRTNCAWLINYVSPDFGFLRDLRPNRYYFSKNMVCARETTYGQIEFGHSFRTKCAWLINYVSPDFGFLRDLRPKDYYFSKNMVCAREKSMGRSNLVIVSEQTVHG